MSKYPFHSEIMRPTLSDLLAYEISPLWSREEASLSATEVPLYLGTVLTLNGDTFEPVSASTSETSSDDSDTNTDTAPSIMAVLARDVVESAENQTILVFRRGCILKKEALIFSDTLTEADKVSAIETLSTADILVR